MPKYKIHVKMSQTYEIEVAGKDIEDALDKASMLTDNQVAGMTHPFQEDREEYQALEDENAS